MGHEVQSVAVIGLGPVGRAVTELLTKADNPVTVLQRSEPVDLPKGARFVACDAREPDALFAGVKGCNAVIVCLGLPYDSAVWTRDWPRVMAALIRLGRATGLRIVFFDNLYMYGPQNEPVHTGMPLTRKGHKPRVRAAITRDWQTAVATDQDFRFVALRASDFYGPGQVQSHLGSDVFRAILTGQPVQTVLSPDLPHDFAYVPDIARALCLLLDAPDTAYGRAWHLPCAPTETPRQILQQVATMAGKPLKLQALSPALLPIMGMVVPILREMVEMRFQFDRPYRVEAADFVQAFDFKPTPFATGLATTLEALSPQPLPTGAE
jgi:nucleoside-diphosphate-sugar epimerase